ncbi:MAG: HPr family phosphocarrier protein [Planctomycetaceae bacterium]|nr:HPr family phosphocarrier protein [Planctomycetaceae bacterium]
METADTICRQVRVTPEDGLHLRPLQLLVRKALTFSSAITLTFDGRRADVKSAFDLMLLAAPTGAILTLETSGPDATAAADAICELFQTGFVISGSEVH